jgi:hypothetical protein
VPLLGGEAPGVHHRGDGDVKVAWELPGDFLGKGQQFRHVGVHRHGRAVPGGGVEPGDLAV